MGFDDIDAAEVLRLTTVRQPLRESGFRGTELLLNALHGAQAGPIAELAALRVVARDTTASSLK